MPDATRHSYPNPAEKQPQISVNYEADPQWSLKPLTPAQLLFHDIRLETWRPDRGPMLEINERVSSSLVPNTAAYTPSESFVRVADATSNPIERQRFTSLEEEYGWLRHTRLRNYQRSAHDPDDWAKCRWIHCSSKFPEYLRGFLWALSDDITTVAGAMRMLDHAISRHTRFSKHGKYFAPFSQTLRPRSEEDAGAVFPLLISVPFLDWTVTGKPPPLRYQIDKREGFRSTRSSSHVLRSVLQHYYRLEDTTTREPSQVFTKHKPWGTDRELDLKVRQFYGHYPSSLDVDELWVLVVDPQHIVTFSSNQTWKSRWPPLQLSSRISDVSFRGLRNNFFRSDQHREYTALTHAIASLGGAVGMLHRNFWPDIVLCLTDRYAGHLSHLQYRLHRSPSTKLVMDLIACQEELNIVIQITEQQLDMIRGLHSIMDVAGIESPFVSSPVSRRRMSTGTGEFSDYDPLPLPTRRDTYRQISSSNLPEPVAQLIDNLERELNDLRELRDNADRHVTRTIQLVNIRLEDHGKAILVFTVVTIIFLPLNFVSSFFGMNVNDIRNLEQSQWLFWAVALSVTVAVLSLSTLLAFSGGDMLEIIMMWRDQRRDRQRDRQQERTFGATSSLQQRPVAPDPDESSFKVYGTDREDRAGFVL